MTTHKTFNPTGAPNAALKPESSAERLEEDALLTGAVGWDAVRVGAVVAIGLLVCPPLAVLVFLFVVPFLIVALAIGLLLAVLSTPYLLFHHFRNREAGHMSLLRQRVGRAARALLDLAPHRIVADARKLHPDR
jgi:hypothetical protein